MMRPVPLLSGVRHGSRGRLGPTSGRGCRRPTAATTTSAAYDFHVAHVLWELGCRPESVKTLCQSNKVRPKGERQEHTHATRLLATRLMEMRDVEEACREWGPS